MAIAAGLKVCSVGEDFTLTVLIHLLHLGLGWLYCLLSCVWVDTQADIDPVMNALGLPTTKGAGARKTKADKLRDLQAFAEAHEAVRSRVDEHPVLWLVDVCTAGRCTVQKFCQ